MNSRAVLREVNNLEQVARGGMGTPMKLCVSFLNHGKAEFFDNLLPPSDGSADGGLSQVEMVADLRSRQSRFFYCPIARDAFDSHSVSGCRLYCRPYLPLLDAALRLQTTS